MGKEVRSDRALASHHVTNNRRQRHLVDGNVVQSVAETYRSDDNYINVYTKYICFFQREP